MVALVTLGAAEGSSDKEDLFEQLLAAIKNLSHTQVVVMPPPPTQNDAYVRQAKQLLEKFPDLYSTTVSGGSLLQIGRYGAREDRRYVNGDKWNKDGILALKEHLIQVSGHHWLRNVPKANATFTLRQLGQLQVGPTGNAPAFQPSTSHGSHDSRLHSTQDGRITRRNAPARPNQRSSNHSIDPRVLNDIISALHPSGSGSSPKFHRNNPKRK